MGGGFASPLIANAQSTNNPNEEGAVEVKRVPPIMPPNAETSGYCCMVFDVNKSGIPENIKASYCTDEVFTNASKEAVSKWRYSPAEADGKGVKRWNEDAMMSFRLSDKYGLMVPSSTGYLAIRQNRKLTPPPMNDRKAYSEWFEKTYVTDQPCGDLLS